MDWESGGESFASLTSFALPSVVAGSALAALVLSAASDDQVVASQRVPVDALVAVAAQASEGVHSASHGLHVRGVDAPPIATQVVDVEAIGDRGDEVLVGVAVGLEALVSLRSQRDHERAVPVHLENVRPQPAASAEAFAHRSVAVDLGLEASRVVSVDSFPWCHNTSLAWCYDTRYYGAMTDTVRVVPNKPKTPLHSFRVDDALWEAAKVRAEERGETLADALRKFLRRYTK